MEVIAWNETGGEGDGGRPFGEIEAERNGELLLLPGHRNAFVKELHFTSMTLVVSKL